MRYCDGVLGLYRDHRNAWICEEGMRKGYRKAKRKYTVLAYMYAYLH